MKPAPPSAISNDLIVYLLGTLGIVGGASFVLKNWILEKIKSDFSKELEESKRLHQLELARSKYELDQAFEHSKSKIEVARTATKMLLERRYSVYQQYFENRYTIYWASLGLEIDDSEEPSAVQVVHSECLDALQKMAEFLAASRISVPREIHASMSNVMYGYRKLMVSKDPATFKQAERELRAEEDALDSQLLQDLNELRDTGVIRPL